MVVSKQAAPPAKISWLREFHGSKNFVARFVYVIEFALSWLKGELGR